MNLKKTIVVIFEKDCKWTDSDDESIRVFLGHLSGLLTPELETTSTLQWPILYIMQKLPRSLWLEIWPCQIFDSFEKQNQNYF